MTLENWIKNWNKDIQKWNADPQEFFTNDIFSSIYSGKNNLALIPDALPEPYFGNPYQNSAVILNLNPGPVIQELQKHETGKFISQSCAVENYEKFATDFPYLGSFSDNKGADWWLRRKSWLSRLCETRNGEGSIQNPFALEICYWHSQSWGKLNFRKKETAEYLEGLFSIAQQVNKNSDLKVIVSVGKLYCSIFDFMGFKKLVEVNKNNFQEFGLKYPLNPKSVFSDRTFSLYESPDGAIIYNTWHTGGNKQPTTDWLEIEKYVLSLAIPISDLIPA